MDVPDEYSAASQIVKTDLCRSWSEDYEVFCVPFANILKGDTISINYDLKQGRASLIKMYFEST